MDKIYENMDWITT